MGSENFSIIPLSVGLGLLDIELGLFIDNIPRIHPVLLWKLGECCLAQFVHSGRIAPNLVSWFVLTSSLYLSTEVIDQSLQFLHSHDAAKREPLFIS